MNQERKRAVIGISLIVLLAAANFWIRRDDGSGAGSIFSNYDLDWQVSPQQKRNLDLIEQTPELHFTDLGNMPEQGEVPSRNPFIYGVDRRKEEEQQARLEAMARMRADLEAKQAQQKEEQETPKETEPEIRFNGQVIGLMEDQEAGILKLAVRMDDEIYIIRQGDVLSDAWRLEQVSYEAARFEHLERRKTVEISLESN